ncbi:uncharacterized protein LOC136037964 [Artemia franciscana]|uniref:Uncharacterized protein n=1 Tax=Artemia franciscana TaxID=6661 RepID=A0AA88L1N4_ARTSF|nr:hypothetical protein QYM36_010310 [Artemia franciscana]
MDDCELDIYSDVSGFPNVTKHYEDEIVKLQNENAALKLKIKKLEESVQTLSTAVAEIQRLKSQLSECQKSHDELIVRRAAVLDRRIANDALKRLKAYRPSCTHDFEIMDSKIGKIIRMNEASFTIVSSNVAYSCITRQISPIREIQDQSKSTSRLDQTAVEKVISKETDQSKESQSSSVKPPNYDQLVRLEFASTADKFISSLKQKSKGVKDPRNSKYTKIHQKTPEKEVNIQTDLSQQIPSQLSPDQNQVMDMTRDVSKKRIDKGVSSSKNSGIHQKSTKKTKNVETDLGHASEEALISGSLSPGQNRVFDVTESSTSVTNVVAEKDSQVALSSIASEKLDGSFGDIVDSRLTGPDFEDSDVRQLYLDYSLQKDKDKYTSESEGEIVNDTCHSLNPITSNSLGKSRRKSFERTDQLRVNHNKRPEKKEFKSQSQRNGHPELGSKMSRVYQKSKGGDSKATRSDRQEDSLLKKRRRSRSPYYSPKSRSRDRFYENRRNERFDNDDGRGLSKVESHHRNKGNRSRDRGGSHHGEKHRFNIERSQEVDYRYSNKSSSKSARLNERHSLDWSSDHWSPPRQRPVDPRDIATTPASRHSRLQPKEKLPSRVPREGLETKIDSRHGKSHDERQHYRKNGSYMQSQRSESEYQDRESRKRPREWKESHRSSVDDEKRRKRPREWKEGYHSSVDDETCDFKRSKQLGEEFLNECESERSVSPQFSQEEPTSPSVMASSPELYLSP